MVEAAEDFAGAAAFGGWSGAVAADVVEAAEFSVGAAGDKQGFPE